MMLFWESSDARIIKRVLSGKHEEFGVLVERYLTVARSIARSNLVNLNDAEDVAQESFITAFQRLNTLQFPQKFGPWFMTIVRNTARTWSRRQTREVRLDDVQTHEPSAIPHPPERVELLRLLESTLAEMDPVQREIIELHYYNGKTLREIAALQDITREAAAKRLQRAREALGERFLDQIPEERPSRDSIRKTAKAMLAVIIAAPAIWKTSPAYAATGSAAIIAIKAVLTAAIVTGAATTTYLGVSQYNKPAAEPVTVASSTSSPAGSTNISPTPASEKTAAPETASAEEAVSSDAPENGPQENPTGPGRIHGVFVTPQDQVVGNLEVAVEKITWGPNEMPPAFVPRWKTQADAAGEFSFDHLPLGMFCLVGQAPGKGGARGFTLSKDRDEIKSLSVKVYPAMPCSGLLQDANGAPIAGALIYPVIHTLFPDDEFDHSTVASLRAVTDAEGKFSFPGLIPGPWKLFALPANMPPAYIGPFSVPAVDGPVAYPPAGSCSGRVVSARDGKPVSDLTVTISQGQRLSHRKDVEKPIAIERIHFDLTTDADGKFRIDDMAPGAYILGLDNPRLALPEGKIPFEVASGYETSDIEVQVIAGGLVSGRVYNKKTNDGVPGIEINGYAQSSDLRRSAVTDSSGNYALMGLPPGTFNLGIYVDADGYLQHQSYHKTVEIDPNQPQESIDFPIDPGVQVKGIVYDKEGKAVAGAQVIGKTQSPYSEEAKESGVDGRFALTLHENAVASIQARKDGWESDSKALSLKTEGMSDVTLTLVHIADSRIEGKVLDEKGQPMSRANVSATCNDADGGKENTYCANSTLSGAFTFENMKAGEYSLSATPYRQNYNTGFILGDSEGKNEVKVKVGEHATVKNVEIRFKPAGSLTIAGRVTALDGKPLPLAVVALSNSTQMEQTLPDGSFEFSGLAEGNYTVYAGGVNYAPSQQSDVAAGTRNLILTLGPPAVLAGTVTDQASNAPISQFSVSFSCRTALAGLEIPGIEGQKSFIEPTGQFRMEKAPALPLMVKVEAKGYLPWQTELDAPANGATVEIAAALTRGAEVHGFVHDADGNPLANVSIITPVRFYDIRYNPLSITTASGVFEVKSVDPENANFIAWREDFAITAFSVDVASNGVAEADVTMTTGGSLEIHGTLDGQPLDQFTININSPINETYELDGGAFLNGIDGVCTVAHLSPGEKTISLIPGAVTGIIEISTAQKVEVEAGQTKSVTLNIQTGTGVIQGVVSQQGSPVSGVAINVNAQEDDIVGLPKLNKFATTDADGHYRIEELPTGDYHVQFFYRNPNPTDNSAPYLTHIESATVTDGGVVDKNWELRGLGRLRVHLTGNIPAQEVVVAAY